MRFCFSLVIFTFVAAAPAAGPITFSGPPRDEPMRRIGDDRFRIPGHFANTALSRDGKRLAILSTAQLRNTAIVTIFDVATRRPLVVSRRPYSGAGVFAGAGLAFSPDGTRVAATVNSTTAFAIDAATGREVWRDSIGTGNGYSLAAFDSTGRLIRTAEKETRIVDPATGTDVATWPVGGILAVSPDGKSYARVKKPDAEIEIGDATTGQSKYVLPLKTAHDGSENGFAFSHDGRTLAVVHAYAEIHLVDLATGRSRQSWKLVEHTFPRLNAEFAIAFTPDDRGLVLSTTARMLGWNLDPFRERKTLPLGQTEFVTSWQFAPDGTLLVPRNGIVERWNPTTGERLPEEFPGGGEAFAVTPDGAQLALGDRYGQVGLWNAETGAFVRPLATGPGKFQAVRSLAISPDGRNLALYRQEDGDLELFPLSPIASVPSRSASVASSRTYLIAWSADSRHVYGYRTERYRREFVQFDVKEMRKDRAFELKEPLAISPDGRDILVVESMQKVVQNQFVHTAEVHRLDIATAKPLGRLPGDEREDRKYEKAIGRYSPDGSIFALATDHRIELLGTKLLPFDATEAVRDGTDWKVEGTHYPHVRAIAFTPNGRWLVSAGDDCAVKVWEVATGKLVRRFDGHDLPIANVAVARDGRSIYTGARDGGVNQWDLTPPVAKLPESAEDLWRTAVSTDAGTGVSAAWKLIGDDTRRAFVLQNLPAVPKTDAIKVKRWLAELDAPAFAVRRAAIRALEELSRGVETELRETLATTPSAEVRERAESLIARFDRKHSPEEVRAMRLVQACEWYRANDLLTAWAVGLPSATLTREARAALARMK